MRKGSLTKNYNDLVHQNNSLLLTPSQTPRNKKQIQNHRYLAELEDSKLIKRTKDDYYNAILYANQSNNHEVLNKA